MTILPVAYLPSVAYMTHLLKEECIIDLHEHYIKRSERNRARILASSGVMELTAHLRQANRPQTPVRDLRLDYSKRWQHQHWGALVASYKASPYFDYFADALAPFYQERFRFLVDFNLRLLETLCTLVRVPMPEVSQQYVEAGPGDADLRPKHAKGPAVVAEPYVQVFADRQSFQPNLSFVDLLFAEGPGSLLFLKRCRLE